MSDIEFGFEDDDEGYCLEDHVPSDLTVEDEYAVYLDEVERAVNPK